MIGMIGVIILIAREIILMTRMIAQISKNTRGNKENTSKGAWAKAVPLFYLFSRVFLHIWAIILVIRMISLAIRMKTPIILIILPSCESLHTM